jgi:hypothetical protein
MKKRIHIFVQEHTIADMNQVSHSGNTPGDYYELDTFIEVIIDEDEDEDEAIEYEVDELLRYDYDLGYIYDNNLAEWNVVD